MRRWTLLTLAALLLAAFLPLATPAHAQANASAEVTAWALNVRAGPGVNYPVIGLVRRGDRLPVLAQQNGWVQIQLAPEGTGWVSGNYVRLASSGAPPAPPTTRPSSPPPATDPVRPAPSDPVGQIAGGQIVLATSPGGPIYTVNANGSGLRQVGVGLDPAWSPDGSKIAYADWRTPRGIYVMNADGSGAARIFDWSLAKAPAWSPDGSRVAFNMQKGGRLEEEEKCFFGYCFTLHRDPWWRVGVVDLSTGTLHEPIVDLHSFSPTWLSADRLLYDGDRGLRVTNPSQNGDPTTLVSESRMYDPRYCAATGKIAVTFRQHDHWEVYTLNQDGSGLTRLTGSESVLNDGTGNSAAPAWSPECSQLLFLSDRDGRWRPYIMEADGSNERPFQPESLDKLRFEYGHSSDRVFDWTD